MSRWQTVSARIGALSSLAIHRGKGLFAMLPRGRRGILTAVIVLTVALGLFAWRSTSAATAVMVPTADITSAWPTCSTTCQAAMQYSYVDEGSTTNTADWIGTGDTGAGGEVVEFGLTNVPNIASASQVTVNVSLRSAVIGSTADTVDFALRVNGTLQTATNVTMTTSFTNYTATFSGSWTQADVDSMQIYLIRTVVGTGPGGSRDDDVQLANAYATLTYVQNITFEQSAYRWFENGSGSTAADETFARTWGGAGADYGMDMATTNDGGYVVTGHTASYGGGSNDMFLAKYDSSGNLSWSRTWGGTSADYGRSVEQTSDNGYVVAGYTASYDLGSDDAFVAKYDSSGNLSWSTVLNMGATTSPSTYYTQDRAYDVTQTGDGGYAITGEFSYYAYELVDTKGVWTKQPSDVFITKLTSAGTESWTVAPAGAQNMYDDVGYSIIEADDGGLVATGSTASYGARTADMFLVKYSSSGTRSWLKTWEGSASDYGQEVAQASDGGYVVTGYTNSYGAGNNDMFLAKYDSSGSYGWSRTWGGSGSDQGNSVAPTSDGGYIVTGFTASYGAGSNDLFLAKYTSSGALSWSRTWGGGSVDQGTSIAQMSDGGYIVSGSTASYGSGGYDMSLLRYNSTGTITGCDSTMCQAPSAASSSVTPSSVSPTGSDAVTAPTSVTPSAGTTSPAPSTTNLIAFNADVGAALAPQSTTASVSDRSTPLRLRMLIGVGISEAVAGTTFKLQYKMADSTACDATGSYRDITRDTHIRYFDNSTLADETGVAGNASDPLNSGVTKVNQTYEEQNPFTIATTITAGQEGMWDFSLAFGSSALPGDKYCIKAVTGTGDNLNTYTHIPSITFAMPADQLQQQDFRLYDNADSTTPGQPLGNPNTGATLGLKDDLFRLRGGVDAGFRWRQVAGNNSHSCAIASDGQAYCWGNGSSGRLGNNSSVDSTVPIAVSTSGVLSGKTVLNVSVGSTHTCAIASDNQAYCWGDNSNGRLGNNSYTTSLTPVAVDSSGVLAGKTLNSISVGNAHTCAIASDNQAYCWGNNLSGQLGNNSTASSPVPVAVDTSGVFAGKTVKSITAGYAHTCAIASDNQAYCWGENAAGRLGNNSTTGSSAPVAVDTSGVFAGKTVKSITAGYAHTCAIASDNQAYCWGGDLSGQLGNNSTASSPVPVAVDTSGVFAGKTVKSITAGYAHTCAIASDNQAYCWGGGSNGKLGNNATANSLVPVAVDTSGVLTGKTVLSVSAVVDYTCVTASDNQAYCWGAGSSGQLGNNSTSSSSVPVAVDTTGVLSGKTILSIAAGGYHTCAIASDNQAYCWGLGSNGQLGNNSTTQSNVPVAVDNSGVVAGKTILSISAGDSHTCAIASDNQAYCWGMGSNGRLGAGNNTQSTIPVPVDTSGALAGKTILSISGGGSHTCAIASDNQAYCWGFNGSGRLGNNTTTDSSVPVAVDTSGVLAGKTILKIAAGDSHTCAIASDNQAYCWGVGSYGRLGNNSTTSSSVPVAVDTSGVLAGKLVQDLTAGFYHTCVTASDSWAYCWGMNATGQLGTNNTTQSLVPASVYNSSYLTGKTIQSISAGGRHTCAIASDNQAYCWGLNYESPLGGMVGIGNSSSHVTYPISVDTSGVLASKTIQSISAGNYHTCAIASDNQAYCWGDNSYGKLGVNNTTDKYSPAAVDVSGVLAGQTISWIVADGDHTCAIASDNQAYCWGNSSYGQLGNGGTANSSVPSRVKQIGKPWSRTMLAGLVAFRLQFAAKSAGTCSVQTGFQDVTTATAIAFATNASVSHNSPIGWMLTDPLSATDMTAQTYLEQDGIFTNTTVIARGTSGLWDFSLKDNNAPASTTYCLRLAASDGNSFGTYSYYPEITIASGGGGGGPVAPTLNQQLRGGQSVIDGIKNAFSW